MTRFISHVCPDARLAFALVLIAITRIAPAQNPPPWDYGPPSPSNPRFQPATYAEAGTFNPMPSVDALIPEFRSRYRSFYDITISDDTLSAVEKERRIATHVRSLSNLIAKTRSDLYKQSYIRIHIRHSCTKTRNTLGTRQCPATDDTDGPKCYTTNVDGMTTRHDWVGTIRTNSLAWEQMSYPGILDQDRLGHVRYAGNAHIPIKDDGRTFCADGLQKSSTGFIRDITYGYFGYGDDYIARKSEQDAAAVMERVV